VFVGVFHRKIFCLCGIARLSIKRRHHAFATRWNEFWIYHRVQSWSTRHTPTVYGQWCILHD